MARLVFIVLIVLLLVYFAKDILPLGKSARRCTYCDGEGYWKGTRGERNFCKKCNGTGKEIAE